MTIKRFCILLLLFSYCFAFANKDKSIKKTYGNITVITSSYDYVEEMNKTLIISQYAEMLSKKHSYSDKIYIYFLEEQFESPSIKAWLPKESDNSENLDGVNVMFRMKEYNVVGCLNIIENVILNKKKLKKYANKQQSIYENSPSNIVSSVLKNKIYRPNEIKELEKSKFFDYYFFDDKFHFVDISTGVEKEFLELDKVVDFTVLRNDLIVVFTNIDEFKVIRPNVEVTTLKIVDVDSFFKPYKVALLADNKISIQFPNLSKFKNRVMLYSIDKRVLIQNVDELFR